MFRRSIRVGLLGLSLFLLPACGGEEEGFRFTVHPTDGKVTSKGKPVANALVRFHPSDPATVQIPDGKEGPPIALITDTDEDGKFTLSTYVADDGIPAGDYVVTVALAKPGTTDVENADGKVQAPQRRVSATEKKYSDPTTTTLKATVKPGENHFEFDLE